MSHPIAVALRTATSNVVAFVHNGQQTRTAAYVDGKRVLVFGDAFYNEAVSHGKAEHYRGYEPFPAEFDTHLQPAAAPVKPGPLARKFTRATEEVARLRTAFVRKPSLRGEQVVKAAVARAEKLKRIVTYLAE